MALDVVFVGRPARDGFAAVTRTAVREEARRCGGRQAVSLDVLAVDETGPAVRFGLDEPVLR